MLNKIIAGSLYFFLSALFHVNTYSLSAQNVKVFSTEKLIEDFKVFIDALHEAYPSTYRYNTRKDIEQFFTNKLNGLKREMTEKQFFQVVAITAAKIKDEHLIPGPSEDSYREYKTVNRFLPFNLKIINSKMHINKSVDIRLKAGSEIISINGMASKDILHKLIQYIPHDGYIRTFSYRHLEDYSPTQNENLFDLYFSIFYTLRDTFSIKVKSPGNIVSEIAVKTLNYKEYVDFYQKRTTHEPALDFRALSKEVSYLNISSFHSSYREMFKQDFEVLFRQIFMQLDSSKTENLILDLRRCEGGDNSYLWLLAYLMNKPFKVIDYLEVAYSGYPVVSKFFENPETSLLIDSFLRRVPSGMYRLKTNKESSVPGHTEINPEAFHFKGKLFVLTGGATGSAAGIVATILRNNKRAIFVGEESGGAMEGPTALNISVLVLPNTKIKIEIPHIREQLAVTYIKGRGVIPEFSVEQTMKDLINNVDTQLEFVLDLIKRGK